MNATLGYFLINKSLPLPVIIKTGDMDCKERGWFDKGLRC
jgi:hypothetical protein